MPGTYVKIQSVTVTGATQAAMEFTSIPDTFDDLLLKISVRDNSSDGSPSSEIRFNGSNSGYTNRRVLGYNGTLVASFSDTSIGYGWGGFNNTTAHTASTFSNTEIYIPNYAGSTNKSFSMDTVLENNSATLNALGLYAEIWANTSAIASIAIKPVSASFVTYSTAVLYGIKKS